MKPAVISLVAIFIFAAATRGQSEGSVSRQEIRFAMLDGFHFEAKEISLADRNSPILKATENVAEPDAVVLEKMVVKGRRRYKDLSTDVGRASPLRAQSQSGFGTGIHEKDFGKIRAYSLTILYVPIQAGISW